MLQHQLFLPLFTVTKYLNVHQANGATTRPMNLQVFPLKIIPDNRGDMRCLQSVVYVCLFVQKYRITGTSSTVFRLDALAKALSVIATATWLAGCPSHSGIVSKRLNLSETFFDHLKAPSF